MRRPFFYFLLFLAALSGCLGAMWLRQGPTSGEIFLVESKVHDFEAGCRSVHGVAWWTPNFLQGHSLAGAESTFFTVAPLELGRLLFGFPAGYKIVGLAALVAAGIAMFLFLRALTGSEMTAVLGGAFYVLCPELAIRLARAEHLGIALCFPFAPAIAYLMLRLAREGRPSDRVLLGLACGAFALAAAKVAVLFAPAIVGFGAWLALDLVPERRRLFLFDLASAFGIAALLAIPPLLPLMREQKWMNLFTFEPMAAWQHAFTIKTALSWWDRNGSILSHAPQAISVSGDAFYFGLVWSVALAAAFLGLGIFRGWLETREGGLCRLFVGLTLLFHWLATGPVSIWSAHRAVLASALNFPNGSIALLWLGLLAQGGIVAVLVRHGKPWGEKRWVTALALAVYFFVPLFSIVSRIPLYAQLRAPAAFWNVGGSFCLAVAGALAVGAAIGQVRWRAIAAMGVVILLTLDFSGYLAGFARGTLPDGTDTDFLATAEFLRKDPTPGSLYVLSGRYFYLDLPRLTGRGLFDEAGTRYYQLRWVREASHRGEASADDFRAMLAAGGVGFLVLDKTDPDLNPAIPSLLKQSYPVAFENPHFAVLHGIESGNGSASAPSELRRGKPAFASATLQGPGQPLALLAPRQADYHLIRVAPTSAPWVIVPEAWHPDWTAQVDGKPISVERAGGCYLAAKMPHAGAAVTFRFQPPAWYNGALRTAAAIWLATGAAFLWLRRRERRS